MGEQKPSYRYSTPTKLLPSDVTLADIRNSLPKEVFVKNGWKAAFTVIKTIVMVIVGFLSIYYCPHPLLLPLAWFFTGTAATGLFVIGHDCAHRAFSNKPWINDVVGTAVMTLLVYPYESWKIKHNHHHAYTNLLVEDNAWQPFTREEYNSASPMWKFIFRTIKGPMWWFASVGHQIKQHFDFSLFRPEDVPRVKVSVYLCYAFAACFFPAALYFGGIWWTIKYYVFPWLGYHFWMSTFTMVHHTAPDIKFMPREEWNPARAQLQGTVHCDYPAWVEFLCHDINVHIPHHIATGIPSYNLRAAHDFIRQKYKGYIIESKFTWEMLKDIITQCHIYDEEKCYVPFPKEDGVAKKEN